MPSTTLFTAPRDGRSPVVERLEWRTDVQISRNGTERRTAQRPFPRHTVNFTALLHTDAARASLETLRTGVEVLVPLWQHAFARPADTADAGYLAANGLALLDHSGAVVQEASPVLWPAWAQLCAPLALARLDAGSRSAQSLTWGIASAPVSFQLLNYNEGPGAYTGPTSTAGPGGFNRYTMDPFTVNALGGYSNEFSESTEFSANTVDNGLADGLFETRYTKSSVSCVVTLTSRAQILAFRRFLFRLQGRLVEFYWTATGIKDREVGTYRLADDAVELTYLHPGFATCNLNLIRLA